ncbi:Nif11-like leader peptide family RiPP precursor [Nisaea denitrificans]|uniref:Nif11-like leader peptide family RiPP precursor n=1 Tax=Nisaea denitrificans TaxID=390877 RepID=UPI0003FD3B48|nr:Nif11-like leader peptide family RiPP precursor [Nisaea denitrificans]
MSMQTMTEFLEKAQADEKLGEQLVTIIHENEPEEIFPKVVTLANDNGFTVTVDDVKEVQRQFEKAGDSADGDLSDEDLENVSGGVLLMGLGLAMTGIQAAQAGIGIANTAAGMVATAIDPTRPQGEVIGDLFKKW